MEPSFSSYSPIVFITNALLPLRFVNPSSLNLFNNSIKNGIKGKTSKRKSGPSQAAPSA